MENVKLRNLRDGHVLFLGDKSKDLDIILGYLGTRAFYDFKRVENLLIQIFT